MPRVPRRYSIHLILSGGQTEVVHFATLEAFQQWYTGVCCTVPVLPTRL